ncbi:MAG: hypothetical protein IPP71_20740 [Bacteroidetes bacterium]|nr:hypothetical protein [Bacteroidota bacterium]
MKWIDQSIEIKETFPNLNTKSKILAGLNKTKEAGEMKSKALAIANEAELNAYGYQLLGTKKVDEAVEVFKLNVQRYPGSWNVYDSLAETLEIKGDQKGALANYKMALKKAPEGQKKRIEEAIRKNEKKS